MLIASMLISVSMLIASMLSFIMLDSNCQYADRQYALS